MEDFYGFTQNRLKARFAELGIRPFAAAQTMEWVYGKGVRDFAAMSNIAKKDAAVLQAHFAFGELRVIARQISRDGTVKFLAELADGARIETVFMPFSYGNSACITTQVGCNMGCTFCASGLMKKERNLTVAEMVRQLVMVQEHLTEAGKGRLSHFVVMGIGEPLDNFANLVDMLDVARDPKGLAIGSRHITVSTCGVVPKIAEFARAVPQVNLAISLHAPNDEIRGQLMPINRAFPLVKLIAAAREYVAVTKRRITYEYVLIDGVNDSVQNATDLAALVQGQLAYVNLIPYNSVIENGFVKSTRVHEFHQVLVENGIPCTVRMEKGADIDAACGQLRAKDRGVIR